MGSQGYLGLPSYYSQSSDPITPNLGMSLKGMDPILAENLILIDNFAGTPSSSVKINGSVVANPNFNNTTPAAPGGSTNVTWQVDGSGNVSAYIASSGSGTVTSFSAGTLSPLFTTSVATPTTTPALSFSLSNANANSFLAGPTSGGAGAPTYRAIGSGDIPSGTVLWNQLGNAGGNLTLANAGNTTTFNQTSAVAWQWANTTVATALTTNASPLLELLDNYWTGAASAVDTWTIGSSLAAGSNGSSTLLISHVAGSTGVNHVDFSFGSIGTALRLSANPASATAGTGMSVVAANRGLILAGNMATTGIPSGIGVAFFNNSTFAATTTTIQYGISMGTPTAPFVFGPASGTAAFVGAAFFSQCAQTSTGTGNFTGSLVSATTAGGGFAGFLGTTFLTADFQNDNGSVFQIGETGAIFPTGGGTNGTITDNTGALGTTATSLLTSGPSGSGVVWKIWQVASTNLTAQSAAITATNLTASAPATGMYEITWSADITTAATASSTLGGANGFQVIYTSPTDSVVKTTVAGNSITSAANTTGTAVGGSIIVYAKTGTAIQFTYGYTSSGATAMVYELHITVKAL